MPFDFFQYQVRTQTAVFTGETVLEPEWHQPWSTPLRAAVFSFALLASDAVYPAQTITPEVIISSKWYAPWSEPVRLKIGMTASLQQATTFGMSPIGAAVIDTMGWRNEWQQQPPPKAGLGTHHQQAFTISPTAFTLEAVLESKWHQPWSEPSVKEKKGLGAYLQRTFTIDATTVFGIVNILRAYRFWAEPVKEKIGFKAYLQQTLAWGPQTLPNPTVTVTIGATETNSDIFAGAMTFGGTSGTTVPVSAVVSIFETGNPTGSTGVWET